jgi:secreted trypsin-like serine protease
VVIHPRVLLTAAHCMVYNGRGPLEIRINARDESPLVVTVTKAITHPQYNSKKFSYDVGLLILSEDVKEPTIVANIPLIADHRQQNQILRGVGLGTNGGAMDGAFNNTRVQKKKSADMKLVGMDGSAMLLDVVNKGQGMCQGDSGGPVYFDNPGQPLQLVGLFFGDNGEACGFPGYKMYAEFVPSWLDWIREQTGLQISGDAVVIGHDF